MELTNHIALITGGTAGIGLESARLMVREGAQVVITGRDTARGEKAVADIGGDVRFLPADLSDLESVKSLVAQLGPVDIIVNNAGSFPVAPTVDQNVTSFETIFDTNVRGAYFLVAALVPGMLERGRGSIVNVTTLAAFKGIPGASGYSASKSALSSLTRTWAAEFGSRGVRVNSVSPGPTRTDGVLAEWGESIEDIAKTLPLGRTARAEEIAEGGALPRLAAGELCDRLDVARRRRRHRGMSYAGRTASMEAIRWARSRRRDAADQAAQVRRRSG